MPKRKGDNEFVVEAKDYAVPKPASVSKSEKQTELKKPPRAPRRRPTYPKTIKVHFDKASDANKFAILIGQRLYARPNSRSIEFAASHNPKTNAIRIHNAVKPPLRGFIDHGRKAYRPKKRKKWNTDRFFDQHWIDMPDFEQERSVAWISYRITFKTETDFACFARLIKQPLSTSTKAIWFPEKRPHDYTTHWWISRDGKRNQPRYPIFIPSKGRAAIQKTMTTLSRMGLRYYVMVEPQEYEEYKNFMPPEATVLQLSRGNHGNGSGIARNACWNYARDKLKAKRLFILDDNIDGFYRLHQNKRYRCGDGTPFRVLEDFVDRYKNVPLAGFQYRFFKSPDQKHYPFTVNTRIFSAALMSTEDKRFQFRCKYNEDTVQSIDVLKAGLCTIEFNAFLQGKLKTQSMSGGNTDEVYEKKTTRIASRTTLPKSQMLEDIHPDVCRVDFRFGRWHHDCDFSIFHKNQLRRTDAWIKQIKKRGKETRSIDTYKMRLVPIPK